VFYFQQLLNAALAGIDHTAIVSVMSGIGYAILLIGFLLSLYQAALKGGDVRGLGIATIKYVTLAIIVANWSTVFHDINNGFTWLAQKINETSGVVDMFANWGEQLQQQLQTNPGLTLWDLVTGDLSGLLTTLLVVVAYVLFIFAMVIFTFFYALYGSLLYVLGPPVLSLLPVLGARELAKSYAQNLMIWNAWAVLYAVFGTLITAIHMDRVNQVLGNGAFGWLRGLADAPLLGLVSIVYAICIALIPMIAKRVVSGDVGSTVGAIVATTAAVIGVAVAGASGVAAGAGVAGGGGASAGAGQGGASAGAGSASSAAASSSGSAPSRPTQAMTLGESLQAGPRANSSGSSKGSETPASRAGGSRKTQGGSESTRSGGGSRSEFYRPTGVMQSLSFTVGRSIGRAVASRQDESQQSGGEQ